MSASEKELVASYLLPEYWDGYMPGTDYAYDNSREMYRSDLRTARFAKRALEQYMLKRHRYFPEKTFITGQEVNLEEMTTGTVLVFDQEMLICTTGIGDVLRYSAPNAPVPSKPVGVSKETGFFAPQSDIMRFRPYFEYMRQTRWGVKATNKDGDTVLASVPSSCIVPSEKTGIDIIAPLLVSTPSLFTVGSVHGFYQKSKPSGETATQYVRINACEVAINGSPETKREGIASRIASLFAIPQTT